MRSPHRGSVVIVGAPGTLSGLEAALRRRRWRVVRASVIRPVACPMGPAPAWLGRDPPPDGWIVTSRAIVTEFWRRNPAWRPGLRRIPRLLAVGPGTARALRSVGLRPTPSEESGGAGAVLRRLGPVRGQRFVYLRSDRAGGDLARALRRRGARVYDRVAYRVVVARRMPPEEANALLGARAWLLASPSALRAFHRSLGPTRWRREAGRVTVLALGARTAREARRRGLRNPRVPRQSSEAGLARLFGEVFGDATA